MARTGKTALELLRALWTDPRSIDPRFHAAEVTRAVAKNLSEVSKYLEERIRIKGLSERDRNLEIEESSLFLMRVLFCMFAEDIGLLPARSFENFLKRAEGDDQLFANGLRDLFERMDNPDPGARWAWAVETNVRYFNGRLFEDGRIYPLGGFLVHNLYEAARQNWRRVEPAIFGTLLEQALDAKERSKLGAHYTPRPYVEVLVRATIMDVLEPEWEAIEERIEARLPSPLRLGSGQALGEGPGPGVGDVKVQPSNLQAPPLTPPLKGRGTEEALTLAQSFHDKLAKTRVLDPACGTGNFLYVAMELLQALESKVIERIQTLGGQAGPRIGPQQFYGLELNPRAAKIAELVLWIGWLRNRLKDDPGAVPEPVLKGSANLNMGRRGRYDAILRLTETGEPDYENPKMAEWPEAEFIVGNPPFIGGKDLRERLGDDYAEAMWAANDRVPKSADFVMQWWDRAAHTLVAEGSPLHRFGFVTTNSITQEFSRRVIANYLSPSPPGEGSGVGTVTTAEAQTPPDNPHPPTPSPKACPEPSRRGAGETGLSLLMAIPDHPWTKATKDAAAVRIAMTVARKGMHDGSLREVTSEAKLESDNPVVGVAAVEGRINANLTVGASASEAKCLLANHGIAYRGVQLIGSGFIVTEQQARDLGLGKREGLEKHIRPYRNGRDLLQTPRGVMVIDLLGLDEKGVRQRFPEVYQHLLRTVHEQRKEQVDGKIAQGKKPTKDAETYLKEWLLHGKPRQLLRDALGGLDRYIATVETAKHRIFQFLNAEITPDNMLIAVGSDDPLHLGALQSHLHTEWALRTGAWLGVGNDNRYSKSKVFDPFPFPDATDTQCAAIAELAEELDETRKLAIAETDKLTMTELYNLREKLRSGEPLSDQESKRAAAARAGIVNRLHEQLDSAVADAYGWKAEWDAGQLGPSEIVARLVALNHTRAGEEAQGHIRWLRPDYQIPRFAPDEQK